MPARGQFGIGAVLQQHSHRVGVPGPRRAHQRRGSLGEGRVARIHAAAPRKILDQCRVRIRAMGQQRFDNLETRQRVIPFAIRQRRIVFVADVHGRIQGRAASLVGQIRIRATVQQKLGEAVLLVHDGHDQGVCRHPRPLD